MWLLGCVATCQVPFVIWSVQAAPVSASNTLLGSNKMLKATTEREARLSASERRGRKVQGGGIGKRAEGRSKTGRKKVKVLRGNVAPGAWAPKKTPKQGDSNCAIQLPELLNNWMSYVQKASINEKRSVLRVDRALHRCYMKPDLLSSQNITYHHFIPQTFVWPG